VLKIRSHFFHWRIWALLLIVCLLFTYIPLAAANNLEGKILERFGELESVKDTVSEQQKELKQYKNQEERLLAELRELNIGVEALRRELIKIQQEIDSTEVEIERVTEELHAAQAVLERKDELLQRRLRAIYENGDVNYLEVLFNSTSFPEFITRLNDLKVIAQNDVVLLEEAQEQRTMIQGVKDDLEEKRDNLELLKREQIKRKDELDRQMASRENILGQVQDQIEAQERVIRELEEEAKALEDLIKRLQEEQRRLNNQPPGKLLWPLEEFGRGWITSGYGYRTHPITRIQGVFHGGIDIGIPYNRWPGSASYDGNPVYVRSAADGIVIFSGISGSLNYGYGRLVIVDHGGGMSTIYAHNHSLLVSPMQEVLMGQPLGIVGSTGSSTGPHLHFEVRLNGERVNPMNYF